MAVNKKALTRINEYRNLDFGYKPINFIGYGAWAVSSPYIAADTDHVVPFTEVNTRFTDSIPLDPDEPMTFTDGFIPLPFRQNQTYADLDAVFEFRPEADAADYDIYIYCKEAVWDPGTQTWSASSSGTTFGASRRVTVRAGSGDFRMAVPFSAFDQVYNTSTPTQRAIAFIVRGTHRFRLLAATVKMTIHEPQV